jgi:hypothetical protein
MRYRAEVTSVEGFVQQIACCYLRHGYWFYVTGTIPDHKNPRAVDEKLIEKYGIAVSESTRARRKRARQANLQYLRHDRFFVLMATKGSHRFFQEEEARVQDIRRVPLRYGGYSMSYRRGGRTRSGELDTRWHAHVEIERNRYAELAAEFVSVATHRSVENLVLKLYQLPFEPYAPVRRQFLRILNVVNRQRKHAGYSSIPSGVLPLRRRVVKPFLP